MEISATGKLSPPNLEDFQLKLKRIENSHLEAHQKIESIREVVVSKVVIQLDMTQSDDGTQNKFDMTLKAIMKIF